MSSFNGQFYMSIPSVYTAFVFRGRERSGRRMLAEPEVDRDGWVGGAKSGR